MDIIENLLLRIFIVSIKGFFVFLITIPMMSCQTDQLPLIVGEEVYVTTETIDEGGGTIVVDKQGQENDQ